MSFRVKPLSEILQPARERGTELEKSVFAVFNVFSGTRPSSPSSSRNGATTWKDYPCTPFARPRSERAEPYEAVQRARVHR